MSGIKLFLTVTCLALSLIQISNGAKILGVFIIPSQSHYSLGRSLMVGLANRGHQVTLIAPYALGKEQKNYKEIVIKELQDVLKESVPESMFDIRKDSPMQALSRMNSMGITLSNYTLNYPVVQQLMKANEKFDMVIIEVFMNQCLFGLAHQFEGIPVAYSSIAANKWSNDLVGNMDVPSIHPNPISSFTPQMNYWQRFVNTIMFGVDDVLHRFNIAFQNVVYKEVFQPLSGDALPPLNEVLNNVSLVLLNTHVAVGYPRALVPNMVGVAGHHIDTSTTLPKDIQVFLDNAKEGVVYFSMGSVLRSADLPIKTRDMLLKAFSKLKQKVLWKWEETNLQDLPKNVMIRSWMPQQSILAHPNVKCFITHGGLLSSIESVYFGVPLIGIPIYGDQYSNMARAQHAGYAIKLDYDNLTEQDLMEALNLILTNKSYKEAAQRLSTIFRDELQTPLEKAIYNLEYVLRNKGAPFLRSPTRHLSIFQTMLLDVAAGFGALVVIIFFILYSLCTVIFRMIFKRKPKIVKKKKQ